MQGELRMDILLVFLFGQQGLRNRKQQQYQQSNIFQPLSVSLGPNKRKLQISLSPCFWNWGISSHKSDQQCTHSSWIQHFLSCLHSSVIAFPTPPGTAKQAILPVYWTENQCAVSGCRAWDLHVLFYHKLPFRPLPQHPSLNSRTARSVSLQGESTVLHQV